MKPGDQAVVTKSWHSDLMPGVIGKVVKRMGHGYDVEFTVGFTSATGEKSTSKRRVYFAANEIKRARLRTINEGQARTDDDVFVGGS